MTEGSLTSVLLVDATWKWGYPTTSPPKRECIEKARRIWEEEGLPPLRPELLWYGISLDYWPEEIQEEAQLVLKGAHYKTGETS